MPIHPDPDTAITYRHRHDPERYADQIVYPDTGAHDALRTDPEWERIEGDDPTPRVAAKTPKVGAEVTVDELAGFTVPELRQYAAQRGVGNPGILETRDECIAAIFAVHDPTSLATGAGAEGEAEGGESDGLDSQTRDELDELAESEGVEVPEGGFKNKGEVASAIRAKRAE